MSVFRNSVFVFLGFLCLFSYRTSAQNDLPNLPESKHKLVVIAHRGNHTKVPENTLASVNEAIKYGVDYVEIDLRTTKDGHLVIHHDATVDRATNGNGKISALTLAEIKKLQVYNHNHKTHQIPEFREVLRVCKNKINIYLDFKDADVKQTWKQIQEAGMEKQIVVYVNKKSQYIEWRSVAPKMPLMTSVSDDVKNKEQLVSFLDEVKVEILDNAVNSEMQEVVKEKGIAVWLDVQSPTEGPESWTAAIEKKVQGLQTDHPEALIEYLNKKGLR